MIKVIKTIAAFLVVLVALILSAAIGLVVIIGTAILQLAGLGLLIAGGIAVMVNEWVYDRKQRKALRDRTLDQ
jgi:hypothetical protein